MSHARESTGGIRHSLWRLLRRKGSCSAGHFVSGDRRRERCRAPLQSWHQDSCAGRTVWLAVRRQTARDVRSVLRTRAGMSRGRPGRRWAWLKGAQAHLPKIGGQGTRVASQPKQSTQVPWPPILGRCACAPFSHAHLRPGLPLLIPARVRRTDRTSLAVCRRTASQTILPAQLSWCHDCNGTRHLSLRLSPDTKCPAEHEPFLRRSLQSEWRIPPVDSLACDIAAHASFDCGRACLSHPLRRVGFRCGLSAPLSDTYLRRLPANDRKVR